AFDPVNIIFSLAVMSFCSIRKALYNKKAVTDEASSVTAFFMFAGQKSLQGAFLPDFICFDCDASLKHDQYQRH
ncbi:hypothetical protein, partial [Phascolarctobacterium succinatutens]|uniref:hypothetical protein n=1 Tax=Phascolarctobacterium succinatutens TaxID=626940 RepID=UPI003AF5201A